VFQALVEPLAALEHAVHVQGLRHIPATNVLVEGLMARKDHFNIGNVGNVPGIDRRESCRVFDTFYNRLLELFVGLWTIHGEFTNATCYFVEAKFRNELAYIAAGCSIWVRTMSLPRLFHLPSE